MNYKSLVHCFVWNHQYLKSIIVNLIICLSYNCVFTVPFFSYMHLCFKVIKKQISQNWTPQYNVLSETVEQTYHYVQNVWYTKPFKEEFFCTCLLWYITHLTILQTCRTVIILLCALVYAWETFYPKISFTFTDVRMSSALPSRRISLRRLDLCTRLRGKAIFTYSIRLILP